MRYTPNQKKAHDLNRHISVTAGAGSGKTEVLANRYLKILLDSNVSARQVVAITFTEKAAAELKARVLKKIAEQTASSAGDTSLQAKLETIREELAAAPISTIHAFCARILRECPVKGIGSGFDVLQGVDQRLVLRDAIQSTLRSIANRPRGDETREQLADLLRMFGRRKLEKVLEKLLSHRDALDHLQASLYREPDDRILAAWEGFLAEELARSLRERFPVDQWLKSLNAVLEIAKGKNAPKVRDLTAQLQRTANTSDLLPILSELPPLILTRSGDIAKQNFLGRGTDAAPVEADIRFFTEAAEYFQSFPALTDDDAFLIRATYPLLAVYNQVRDRYENYKRQHGVLDFDDLQIEVKNLLQDDAIRGRLARQYRYIMMDEYQDTNSLQYSIIKPLVSDFESGNLFIVGDRKQSIYGFRGADVRTFRQTLDGITARQSGITDDFVWETETLQTQASEKRGDIHLPEAFRFLRNIVGFVNLVFGRIMGEGKLNEFEVAYEPLIMGRKDEALGDVELLVGQESVPQENDLIAARIRRLIQSKQLVSDLDTEEPRPMRYGDIAILLRSRTRLPEIESALLQARIPYLVGGGIGFYQRQEIYDICNYLQFMEDPTGDNDAALIGILRAPFFSVSDVELFEISQHAENDSFWERVKSYAAERGASATPDDNRDQTQDSSEPAEAVASEALIYARETLEKHLKICRRLPISTLIRRIVNDTGMIGTLSVGLSGAQRWANYEKLLAIAREFDKSDFAELSGFIKRLNLLIEEEDRESQAVVDPSEDVVQVMTIHAAKGLEFPVVILPYLSRRFRFDQQPFVDDEVGIGFSPANPEKNYEESQPSIAKVMKTRQTQKTIAEEKRLFYVAATRARDRLILSGSTDLSGKAPGNCWFRWLFNALDLEKAPTESRMEFPVTIEALTENSQTPISFNLPIRIFRSMDEMDLSDETSMPLLPAANFPEVRIKPLDSTPTGENLSVPQLQSYSHCPTKFYLRHRLGFPITDVLVPQKIDSYSEELDGSATDAAVRRALAQLRTAADCKRDLGKLINDAMESVSDDLAAGDAAPHVKHFLESDIGKSALAADESYCEQEIHAMVGDHVIHGVVDRLFKDSEGLWQIVNYETDRFDSSEIETWIDFYRPKVELQAMLVHRLYPEQQAIPATIFFTSLAETFSIHLSADELERLEMLWIEKIAVLQSGKSEKNRTHCPHCPYFVDEQCLVSD